MTFAITPAGSNTPPTTAGASAAAQLNQPLRGQSPPSNTGSLEPAVTSGSLAAREAPRANGVTTSQYKAWYAEARAKNNQITQGVFDQFILPALVKYGSDGLSGAINGYAFVRERFDDDRRPSNIPWNAHITVAAGLSAIDSSDPLAAAVHVGAFTLSAKAAVTAWRHGGLY